MTARCLFLTAMAEEGPLSTAFVEMAVTGEGYVGFAPRGFFGSPLAVVPLALATGHPGDSPLTACLGIVPHQDVVDVSTEVPDNPPLFFNEEGGWPDLVAAQLAFTSLDQDAADIPVDFASADGGSAGLPEVYPLDDGAFPDSLPAPPPPPAAAPKPKAKAKAKRAPAAGDSLAALQATLNTVLEEQRAAAQAFNGRLARLEEGAVPAIGAGRGSGLMTLPSQGPPPGLSALSFAAGPAPARAGPPPVGQSLFHQLHGPAPSMQAGDLFPSGSTSPLNSPPPLPISPQEVSDLQQRAHRAISPQAALPQSGALPRPAPPLPPPSAAAPPTSTPPDHFAALLQVMEKQTAAIGDLAKKTQTSPYDLETFGDDDDKGLWGLPGSRGARAMQRIEQELFKHPQAITAKVRANRDRRLLGSAGPMGNHPSTRAYLVQEVPFNGAKTASYLLFSMAEVFDLMQQGKWHHAEAHLALTLAAGEQAAMDDWRWHNASRLIMQPAPPFHALISTQGSSMAEPLSHLADPGWLGAAMSYAKDLASFKEASRPSRAPPVTTPPADPTTGGREPGGRGRGGNGGRNAGGRGAPPAAVES